MGAFDGELGIVHDAPQADVKPLQGIVDQPLMRLKHGVRLCQARAVRISLDKSNLVLHARTDPQSHTVDGTFDELRLLTHIRHHALGRIGRGGGAQIGDQIQQCPVILMPDGGD